MVLELTGSQLLQALEAGLSAFPKMEGRFPQVSVLRVTFDPKKPPHHRVQSINIQRWNCDTIQPLDAKATYTFATTAYLCGGKDGFDVLQSGRILRNPELC